MCLRCKRAGFECEGYAKDYRWVNEGRVLALRVENSILVVLRGKLPPAKVSQGIRGQRLRGEVLRKRS